MALFNKPITENIHFFLIEISQQLIQVEKFFTTPDASTAKQIFNRSGYSDNLRSRIQNGVTRQLIKSKRQHAQFRLKMVEQLILELNQLSQLGRQAVKDTSSLDLEIQQNLPVYECAKLIKLIRQEIDKIEPMLLDANSQQAVRLNKNALSLQKQFQTMIDAFILKLESNNTLSDASNALFSCYAIRQMIDLLPIVSDSILSINIGQKMNHNRYQSFTDLATGLDLTPESLQIETVAETRSGSAISGIKHDTGESSDKADGYMAIFKEGEKKKLKEEVEGVESWHDIYPGLAPKILSYNSQNKSASLLIEHLPGHTFESLLVQTPSPLLDEALKHLLKTLKSIWEATYTEEPSAVGFSKQLRKRLPAIYAVHPEFNTLNSSICGIQQDSFDELLNKTEQLETQWLSPFSVYIHGDFNVDNIIYDPQEKRINFIDLHRSCYADYAQDISVFMVSIYRLQILAVHQRREMMSIAKQFFKAARRFAKQHEDTTFELRVTLGLARSFASSTRFILDPSLAKRMYLRSRYLLERILTVETGKEQKFKLPLEDLFIE